MNEPAPGGSTDMGLVAYICYGLALVTGFAGIVGLIIAYLQRGEVAGTWQESHYTWLIRTFWIWLFWVVVAALTWIFVVGMLLSVLLLIWYVVRIVKGFIAWDKRQPIDNPQSWMFG